MLSVILDKRFNCISRAADMLCLFLGEDYSFTAQGEQIDVAEYALHFQTQWRFRDGGMILLASGDVYEPYNDNAPENWEYDPIGRPDEQSSVFDVHVKKLMAKMRDSRVAECFLSSANDVNIIFSNGVIFEQFTPTSVKSEEWRLIDYKNNSQTICYDEDGKLSREQ